MPARCSCIPALGEHLHLHTFTRRAVALGHHAWNPARINIMTVLFTHCLSKLPDSAPVSCCSCSTTTTSSSSTLKPDYHCRVDDDRGRLLASMFLDQGLWERRLHFAGEAYVDRFIFCPALHTHGRTSHEVNTWPRVCGASPSGTRRVQLHVSIAFCRRDRLTFGIGHTGKSLTRGVGSRTIILSHHWPSLLYPFRRMTALIRICPNPNFKP